MKMNKKDVIKKAARMIEQEKEFIEETKNNQNPQVVAFRHAAKGRIDALEDIIFFANRTKK